LIKQFGIKLSFQRLSLKSVTIHLTCYQPSSFNVNIFP